MRVSIWYDEVDSIEIELLWTLVLRCFSLIDIVIVDMSCKIKWLVTLVLIRMVVAPSIIKSSGELFVNHIISILGALQIWYQSKGFKGHYEL